MFLARHHGASHPRRLLANGKDPGPDDATLRTLELIGEAATHIPETIRDSSHEFPWRMVTATRNRLIHGYLGIDNDTIWIIVRDDLPPLLDALRRLRDRA